jgi:hypothetical protein
VIADAFLAVDPFGHRLQPGGGAAVVVLVAFLVSFIAIRTTTRVTRRVSWLPDGVEAGGVHVHHLVLGIVLILLSGFLAFAAPLEAPWWHLVAVGFGVGAGFTLDEFALWVRLEDVYWQDEGRASFDAVVCTLAFAALVVIGTRPFGLDEPTSIIGTAIVVTTVVLISSVCFVKKRVLLGVIGLFVPAVAIVGAVRLARPGSPWAAWRYGDAKRQRAADRFAETRRGQQWNRRLGDLIAGAPGVPGAPEASERDDYP